MMVTSDDEVVSQLINHMVRINDVPVCLCSIHHRWKKYQAMGFFDRRTRLNRSTSNPKKANLAKVTTFVVAPRLAPRASYARSSRAKIREQTQQTM